MTGSFCLAMTMLQSVIDVRQLGVWWPIRLHGQRGLPPRVLAFCLLAWFLLTASSVRSKVSSPVQKLTIEAVLKSMK